MSPTLVLVLNIGAGVFLTLVAALLVVMSYLFIQLATGGPLPKWLVDESEPTRTPTNPGPTVNETSSKWCLFLGHKSFLFERPSPKDASVIEQEVLCQRDGCDWGALWYWKPQSGGR